MAQSRPFDKLGRKTEGAREKSPALTKPGLGEPRDPSYKEQGSRRMKEKPRPVNKVHQKWCRIPGLGKACQVPWE